MKKLFVTSVFLLKILLVFGQQVNCDPNNTVGSDGPPGCILCGEGSFKGRNAGFTTGPIPIDDVLCGDLVNELFLTIIPDETGEVEIEMTASNCVRSAGLRLLVYQRDLRLVSGCLFAESPNFNRKMTVRNLTPGAYYRVVIDGLFGDICDFELKFSGLAKAENTGKKIRKIHADTLPQQLCSSDRICFRINEVAGATDYFWHIPPTVNFTSSSNLEVCLRFGGSFEGEIAATPLFGCEAGETTTRKIKVNPERHITKNFKICQAEFPVTIDGMVFEEEGNHYQNFLTSFGCDSVINYRIIDSDPIVIQKDTFLCRGTELFVDGVPKTEEGVYRAILSSKHEFECDTVVFMDLKFVKIMQMA